MWIELIRDVFRKTKNFDEKIFFAMKNPNFGSKFPKVVPAIMREEICLGVEARPKLSTTRDREGVL